MNTARSRTLRLTEALAATVPAYSGPHLEMGGERAKSDEADHAATYARLMADRPPDGAVWLLAYGSLIWKPSFAHDRETTVLVHGWHRAFCLGWMTSFRGCPDRPGLMMALDRGGACRGVAFRLPAGSEEEQLLATIRRELPFKVSGMTARWLCGQTSDGPRKMIGFAVDRRSEAYVSGLTEDQIATSLATSAGPQGTMAEYLASTVRHLEDRGIRDRYLWRMQGIVADRIAALHAR